MDGTPLSGLRSDHLFLLSLCCDVMCWVCFDSSPHVFVNLIVSPPSLFRCSLANLVPHLVLIIYDYLPFITPCVFLSVVRLLWFIRLHWLYYSPLVLSCQAPVLVAVFCFSAPFSVRPVTVGFYHYTCHSGLAADALRTAQPLARICEQPRQLHCFCRCYGSSRRGDLTICVAEESVHLWLPVEALYIICCPNKHPLYPHLNPASPSWQPLVESVTMELKDPRAGFI